MDHFFTTLSPNNFGVYVDSEIQLIGLLSSRLVAFEHLPVLTAKSKRLTARLQRGFRISSYARSCAHTPPSHSVFTLKVFVRVFQYFVRFGIFINKGGICR